MRRFLRQVPILVLLAIFSGEQVYAACGGTVRTWDADAGTNRWDNDLNWSGDNQPDTASEDAVIVAATRPTQIRVNPTTLGCFEVQSGEFRSRNNRTLIVTGDYFRAKTANMMYINPNHDNFVVEMAGTAAQTYEAVDEIPILRISNNTTVTLTEAFSLEFGLEITGTTTTVYVDNNLSFQPGANALTVPAGTTLQLRSGATLAATQDITVNGTLILDAGTTLSMANGTTLNVASTGNVQVNGASGNTAKITAAGAGESFTFNMAGLMTAQYFRLDRMTANGLNLTGTLSSMSFGEFHNVASAGHAMTIGAAAVIPSSVTNIGFYDDDAHGNNGNINASAYNNTVMTVNNWSGGLGGVAGETDANNMISWGSQAGTELILSDNTASGSPPATILQASGDTLFASFAFSLNQASTATDITSITTTMVGTASSSDVSGVKLYRDGGGGTACVYDAGVDIQIDSTKTLSGSPPEATFSITPGDVSTSSDSDIDCVHVVAGTTGTAQDAKTISFSIEGTGDVTNSQGYSFSVSSGPPVSAGSSEIQGDIPSIWQGDNDDRFSAGNNWDGPAPNATRDCRIGSGVTTCRINQNPRACQNATLSNGGTLNFDSLANTFEVYGNLEVESGFTFSNAALGIIDITGAANQNIQFATAFPNDLTISNTGTAPDNKVTVGADSEIQGDVTISSGVLSVANGITLTVGGNLTVQNGGTLEILPGGTVSFSDASVLTVDSGGILSMVGTSGLKTKITGTTGTSYSVVVNGEIEAQHYIFERMGVSGISIESGATINATYFMQDGAFTYPANNSTTVLSLKRQVPGNTLSGMSFDLNGSTATGVTNIDTTGAAAGTLNITSYSGDIGGPSFDTDPSYTIAWSGATNTLTLTQEATGPTSVEAGSTAYVMGRYGFQQTLAGASYSDADITQLTLELTGTGSASDVSEIRIYSDSDCDSSAGILIGTGTYSGNPARSTFNLSASDLTVAADVASPPLNCIYVEYDIVGAAGDGKTLGVSIANSTDQTNDQNYASSGAVTFPLTLGTPATILGATSTTWTGATDTDWFTGTNWTNGAPDSAKNCSIGNVANNPVINASGAECKNIDIQTGGSLSFSGGASQLDVYGSLTNEGTIAQAVGTIRFIDGGAGLNQTLDTTHTMNAFQIEKTGGGNVNLSGTSVTINSLVFNGGNTGSVVVLGGKLLVLPNGVSVPNGTLEIASAGEIQVGNGQSITVNGGTFRIAGVQDAYPQNEALKGKVTVQSSGQWGFNATSGEVDLVGFILDYMDDNGLVVGGTTNFSDFQSGKFTNLSENYNSMTVMQLNTPNVPSSPTSIEWYWGPTNTPPAEVDSYLIGSSTGCGSNTISFDAWTGDWYDGVNETPDTNTKISETNCDIVISYANSPVALLSFDATPFDANVLLEWVTGSETNHRGFNVYRSQDYDEGYVQLNGELIRNLYTGAGPQGFYRFEDKTAVNGQVYYYMIEDVASSGGGKTLHGPVFAMPLSGLGSPTAPGGGVNDGESDSGADTGNGPGATPIDNIGEVDLGHGVHILSQTDSSLRLEIIPPALSISASALDGAYDVLEMPGYSFSLDTGQPQMLEKVILIEVAPYRSTAQVTNETTLENATLNPYQIQAVPEYSFDGGGGVIPTHNPDMATYSLNVDLPSSGFYDLVTDLKSVGEKKYLEIKVNPILYNPPTSSLRSLQKLTLDIGLDGNAWMAPSPSPNLSLSPSAVPGVLRIRVQEAGMYELLYDDIQAAGLDGYLANVNINNLRLYEFGEEKPLHILSGDSFFNSGDRLRFYTDSVKSLESNESEVVLSPWSLGDQQASRLRYEVMDVDPAGAPVSSYTSTEAHVYYEQDLLFLNDRPLGDLEDHIFWARLGKWTDNRASYWPEYFDVNVDLPDLNEHNMHDVIIKLRVRGRHQFLKNGDTKIELQINANPNMSASKVFNSYYPTTIEMLVPSAHFVAGTNTLRIHLRADHLASLDWALLDLNSVEVFYLADTVAQSTAKELYKLPLDESVRISGFSSTNINIYDFSDHENAKLMSNYSMSTSDGGLTYDVDFQLKSALSEDVGYLLYAVEDTQFKTPTALFMSEGYEKSLMDTDNKADLIVIGNDQFLASSSRLIQERESEGLFVMAVSLDQIYSEFSHGIANVKAIKDFMIYANSYWSKSPRYILLLGDSTSDLRGVLGGGDQSHLPPIPMISGDYIDYGSDNWYVTRDSELAPFAAIGRIPATNQAELEDYIDKILAFESGAFAPDLNAKNLGFYSDEDTLYEQFASKTDNLASTASSENSSVTTYHKQFSDYADIPSFKADIISDFSNGPLIMGFVGHGYEDQWADNIFNVTDASGLNNTKLPMVMGMNCSTGMFYSQDMSSDSLGEALVMNPAGGSILYWGSTTMTVPETQMKLSQGFYQNMSSKMALGKTSTRVGDLTLLSKLSMSSQATAKDALLSYTLLGDPSMRLPSSSYDPAPETGGDSSGGGCGMLKPVSGSGPGPWSFLVLLLPLAVLTSFYRWGKRRHQPSCHC